jgi:hypothetical protein
MDMERRMDRVEKRLDATLKIVQTGMKMLVKMEKENAEFRKETREAIHALIDSQMRTDAQLAGLTITVTALGTQVADLGKQVKALGIKIDRFVDGLGTGGNGSGGGRR